MATIFRTKLKRVGWLCGLISYMALEITSDLSSYRDQLSPLITHHFNLRVSAIMEYCCHFMHDLIVLDAVG
jgi:hypothetical protein